MSGRGLIMPNLKRAITGAVVLAAVVVQTFAGYGVSVAEPSVVAGF